VRNAEAVSAALITATAIRPEITRHLYLRKYFRSRNKLRGDFILLLTYN